MSSKILVVEDNRGIQMSLRDEFESEGYQVFIAENGGDGLAMAKEQKPDLIILDIMLPVWMVMKFAKNSGWRKIIHQLLC